MVATATSKVDPLKCMTPEFRVSFPAVFEPRSFQNQEAKYSIVMLFKNDVSLAAMKKAAVTAATKKWGAKDKWPKNLRLPFRDGAEKLDMQGYEGHTFVSASSKQRPGLVNQRLEPILNEDEGFYAGCYARATLRAFAYDTAVNRGISFGLQNIQKTRDGKPFSGRKKAEDEFEALDMSDTDLGGEGYDNVDDFL